jgi:hypothetical protein
MEIKAVDALVLSSIKPAAIKEFLCFLLVFAVLLDRNPKKCSDRCASITAIQLNLPEVE